MAIEHVTVYRTSDGVRFDTLAAAEAHEATCDLGNFLDTLEIGGIGGWEAAERMVRHANALIVLLQDAARKRVAAAKAPGE